MRVSGFAWSSIFPAWQSAPPTRKTLADPPSILLHAESLHQTELSVFLWQLVYREWKDRLNTVRHSLAALKMSLEGTTFITPSSIVHWPSEIHFRKSTQGILSTAVNVINLSRLCVLPLGVSLLVSDASLLRYSARAYESHQLSSSRTFQI